MVTVLKFPETRQPRVHADVDRCVRHRGTYSLYNYFVIGRDGDTRYRLYLRPMSYFPQCQLQLQNQLRVDRMTQWADGTLVPAYMAFWTCDDPDIHTSVPRVLRVAFSARNSDERLEDFYGAEVRLPYFSDKTPRPTIASLLGPDSRF
jgi:hypothetical protein